MVRPRDRTTKQQQPRRPEARHPAPAAPQLPPAREALTQLAPSLGAVGSDAEDLVAGEGVAHEDIERTVQSVCPSSSMEGNWKRRRLFQRRWRGFVPNFHGGSLALGNWKKPI